MAAVTGAITAAVAVAASLKGQRDAKKAAERAAAGIEGANIESVQQLAAAGRAGEQDILASQSAAMERLGVGAAEASAQLTPFAEAGLDAFGRAENMILEGGDIGGGIGDSIRAASLSADNPLLQLSGDPVQRAMQQQANIDVSGATPEFRNALLTAGNQGIAAAGDIAGINQRGLEALADLEGSTAAQRASALVGQTSALQQLSFGANEARLLGEAAGQRARAQGLETLARAAGENL